MPREGRIRGRARKSGGLGVPCVVSPFNRHRDFSGCSNLRQVFAGCEVRAERGTLMCMVTPEQRPRAPGPLGLVHDLLNSIDIFHGAIPSSVVLAVQAGRKAGATSAALARDYSLSRADIAAILRGVESGDELGTAANVGAWLSARGLLARGTTLSEVECERLRELRSVLRGMAAAHTAGADETGLVDRLNGVSRGLPFAVRFTGAGAQIVPDPSEAARGIGPILVAVFEAMRDGTWRRLKICASDGCPAAFYDASRSRPSTSRAR